MSKIGDALRYIANKMDSKPLSQVKSSTLDGLSKQFTKSSEDVPTDKVSAFISQVNEDVLDPLKEFIEKNPNLNTILPAMFAGGVAGVLAKKAEEKKEITDYMKSLKKFIGKVERRSLYTKLSRCTTPFSVGPMLLGFLPMLGVSFLTSFYLMATTETAVLASGFITGTKARAKLISKNGKFLAVEPHKMVAVSSSGDKLLFCDIEGSTPIPKKAVQLDSKATHLSFDRNKENFYVHQDGRSILFSLDGKELSRQRRCS